MPLSSLDPHPIGVPPGLWAAFRRTGVAEAELAAEAGVPLSLLSRPYVSRDHYFALWRAYAALTGDMARSAMDLASAYAPAAYPPSVLASYHARDYRDALRRMARYKPLCPPEGLTMDEQGAHCRLELEPPAAGPAPPPLLQALTLAFLLELGRKGTGKPLRARSVELAEMSGDVAALEAYFGCAIRIGGARSRLTLSRGDLDLPFVTSNEELLDILTPALKQTLDERTVRQPAADQALRAIKRSLPDGRPSIQTAAKTLGLSSRTLQRRLADEGTSFKLLVDEARRELARAYLADARIEIKDIAFRIGFEDSSSFYRAFRRWENATPADWRAAQQKCRPPLLTDSP
ncbi:AraC family transcriptional regulator [Paenibacillus albicereus]|uniref:AraC family transcriptional regulator n=1 Tax=Paenibacillus albicereus TaxID=2726185 RepID=A0A6H2H0I1_9BACL|nr:AraC family transcriptional regulator [Paenibacillus albicereus]QJC53165.1 AraC family transcriptional regulator [Paenibacillus albicereus]